MLKRKQNDETAAPSVDGNGPPALLVAERVRKVYRTGEIEVEAWSTWTSPSVRARWWR